uniref:Uncharacterized protein n=1 Tax=Rhizophora mucronata TaxID=61149 RepID=A0A2P2JK24_RHIMU
MSPASSGRDCCGVSQLWCRLVHSLQKSWFFDFTLVGWTEISWVGLELMRRQCRLLYFRLHADGCGNGGKTVCNGQWLHGCSTANSEMAQ